jgi:Ca-activated chloride channel family protein
MATLFGNYGFGQPYFLFFFLIIPALLVWFYFYRNKNTNEINISTFKGFDNLKKTFKNRIIHLPFFLRLLAITLIIIAIARPQKSFDKSDVKVEGIDIMLTLDISGSMLAEDFKPNRLEASKEVALEFIDGRPNDRIGLVLFSAESFLQCPLTIDHPKLKSLFANVKSGMVTDGTALGDGLGLSVYHIKKSQAISKVIILMTDGINNQGSLDPVTAAEIAKLYGVRVYTIGVGSKGMAPYPFQTPFGIQYQNIDVQIDEDLLGKVAEGTGGNYFRATDKQKLHEIYKEIDKLEKTKIDVSRFSKKKEEFLIFVIWAVIIFILEILLKYTVLRRIP